MAGPISFTPGSEPAPRPRDTPLQTESFEGLSEGMITALPKHVLPPTAAAYLQDALVDKPGLVRQRGPLTQVSGIASFTNPIVGLIQCYDPAGTFRIAAIEQVNATSAFLSVFSPNFATKTQIPLPTGLSTAPYPLISTSQKLSGGVLIGISPGYNESTTLPTNGQIGQQMVVWDGCISPQYTTGTVSVSQGSTAVVGTGTTFVGNVTPGMFLFDSLSNINTYIGTVQSVTDNTHLVLTTGALKAVSGAYVLRPLRPFITFKSTGEITCSTTSTTVTGANTLLATSALPNTTPTCLYRASDMAFIGRIAGVISDTSVTLAANAAVNMAVERFYMINIDGDGTIGAPPMGGSESYYTQPHVNASVGNAIYCPVGFMSAVYANRQWYADRIVPGQSTRLWFSDTINPESVNVHPTEGDFIDVGSGSSKSTRSPIMGLMAGVNSLLICKEDETFALVGQDETQFEVHKVWNDGTLSCMSMQQWRDEVIFAGRSGIYVWDGTQVSDLVVGTLGREYHNAVKNFDPTTYRMWSSVIRDHYFLFIENVTPQISVTRGASTTTPTRWTICVNMISGALTLLSNVDIRAAATLPGASGGAQWFAINTSSGGVVCNGEALFDNTGSDSFTCTGNTQGPAFFLESRRDPLGDPLRRKLLKQIAADYQTNGGGLTIDTLLGIDSTAASSTNTTSFPDSSGTWSKKRYKFLKHDNYLGFRLYPTSAPTPTVIVGPWQFGFKVQNPGRI